MKWIALGKNGDAYPDAIRKLKGKCGVYAIRHRGMIFTTIVYVGESHTGNLSTTLTRHFQAWKRNKKWWTGYFGDKQTDPGHTYNREECEVSFEVCGKGCALEKQTEWIKRLKPRDNHAGVDELEEAPF